MAICETTPNPVSRRRPARIGAIPKDWPDNSIGGGEALSGRVFREYPPPVRE
jgi:hypothetical protein